jgi:hypothetical protein
VVVTAAVDLHALAALPGYGRAEAALRAAGHPPPESAQTLPVWEVTVRVEVEAFAVMTVAIAAETEAAARAALRDPRRVGELDPWDFENVRPAAVTILGLDPAPEGARPAITVPRPAAPPTLPL